MAPLALLAGLALAAPAARAAAQLPPAALVRALELATQAARALAPAGARIQALPGPLDPRLRLAPCERVDVYLPAGVAAWGRSRVGLRCGQGAVAWNVYLPVTVQVWAPAVVTTAALPAGARLDAAQLARAEVDWAAAALPPHTEAAPLQDRVLLHPLAAGAAPRSNDLQPRLWFALGATVRVVGLGSGFTIAAEGQALTPGIEGQPARVRTESGRVLVGRPVGDHRIEVPL
ncbi:Flagellar basal-body P-ring formation protein flgA [Rubrivivax sp. A210]|uniref:flagellar basal body P-ring formation chaperone FlgA n=1 Tax=Rubrivivax sp. A210 TaxID=2772301 RepID=UPI00191A6CF1|nr:flagellar basal body P-ring formation chaperone FlgA [Rubrivivax sp. A210]CAD5374750.1 Flagellar basal-body P-ring formation protein flgA [Rubrivivax sp. A210]